VFLRRSRRRWARTPTQHKSSSIVARPYQLRTGVEARHEGQRHHHIGKPFNSTVRAWKAKRSCGLMSGLPGYSDSKWLQARLGYTLWSSPVASTSNVGSPPSHRDFEKGQRVYRKPTILAVTLIKESNFRRRHPIVVTHHGASGLPTKASGCANSEGERIFDTKYISI